MRHANSVYAGRWLRCTVVERRSLAGELPCPTLDLDDRFVAFFVGKPSATGQPTRQTQLVISLGSINE